MASPRNAFLDAGGSVGLVGHRVKECCVQLHSCVQKWKELSSRGYDLVDKLINASMQLKLPHLFYFMFVLFNRICIYIGMLGLGAQSHLECWRVTCCPEWSARLLHTEKPSSHSSQKSKTKWLVAF